ncbi:uncharacterized protein LY89DRAFT_715102 [Mollisia scopiformis]|uniref:Uncharacterized protein n=1 Tax=Mollisia scopiformis TaxID=149040 RepID=A0A194XPY7_MOLSC|nr:uncharacterized protein LY89DRAFT_715102 [Mollisia scopiformis]KUJ22119.1 hypothetical protein LY89DRAFT_715102 [Mollisia scopiformis]
MAPRQANRNIQKVGRQRSVPKHETMASETSDVSIQVEIIVSKQTLVPKPACQSLTRPAHVVHCAYLEKAILSWVQCHIGSNASPAIVRTASATPIPIPASAPGDRELLFELVSSTKRPVPVGEVELLVCVKGFGVLEASEGVDVLEEEVVVPEEVVVVLEYEALEELCVEDVEGVDMEEEAAAWLRLHLTKLSV